MDALTCSHVQLIFCVGIIFSVIYLNIISTTSRKCIVHFKAAWHRFPRTSNTSYEINQHRNMPCFRDNPTFVSAGWKSHAMKHEPQNLNLETYHPQVAQHAFRCSSSPSPRNISPPKHVTFQELCFDPMRPSSMFPPTIPSMPHDPSMKL
jgi:hypothetical protein